MPSPKSQTSIPMESNFIQQVSGHIQIHWFNRLVLEKTHCYLFRSTLSVCVMLISHPPNQQPWLGLMFCWAQATWSCQSLTLRSAILGFLSMHEHDYPEWHTLLAGTAQLQLCCFAKSQWGEKKKTCLTHQAADNCGRKKKWQVHDQGGKWRS